MSHDMLGKIVIALTNMPQYWGLLLDVIEKMTKPEFAQELAKFAKKQACWVVTIFAIIRNQFNPSKFVGESWSIESKETDARSVALAELDLTKIQFVTMLKGNETSITGEEKLKRLKESNYIRLDADVFFTLWENQHLIPESWKEKVNENTRYIFFDGTVLRRSDGDRCVLYLYWRDGAWRWGVDWLDYDWSASRPSAVLAA